jgi:myb proto-oncogene protein
MVEEEKKLASAVETFGGHNWDKVAGNVPGRNDIQCRNKRKYLSRSAATTSATASAAWTVEEEKKLASSVETFGTTSWATTAPNIPSRNESQCYNKGQNLSKGAAATACGTWRVEEENKLVSAVETYGGHNWNEIAKMIPGRSENQCRQKWRNMPRKASATASAAWTVEEEKKLASSVETFGTTSWATTAANVPGRNEKQYCDKWWSMSRKASATVIGAWTVEEEKSWCLR